VVAASDVADKIFLPCFWACLTNAVTMRAQRTPLTGGTP
jgi:hypothetical protein